MSEPYRPLSTPAALVLVAIGAIVFSLVCYASGTASTAAMEFAERCQAQYGHLVVGRAIQLCVSPDGRILESR